MKTLKLEHDLANMVRSGAKTSTWRVYDDKDLKVNDEIELIDKVNPANPESWQNIGTAKIDMIVEKRLGEITRADYTGHESFSSREEILKTYQKYYGLQVDFETPVKMIHFSFNQSVPSKAADVMPTLTEAKLYADGGSRGNPGPSASGFAVISMEGQIIVKEGVYLGVTTNNQAEYQALKLGLEHARKMRISTIHVYMDSLLVVNQLLGKFKVRNRDLWPIHEAIKQLVTTFEHVTFTHVPRELNKIADGAVNEALDQAASQNVSK